MRKPSALLLLLAIPAFAQFSLYKIEGNVELPVAAVLHIGSVDPAEAATMRFRLRNTSAAPASLSILSVKGAGFSLAGAPPTLPIGLASQQAIDFTAVFRANATGTYSAALDSEGIAVILTATVLPTLTFQFEGASIPAAGLTFGAVEAAASVARRVTVTNLTSFPTVAPPINVRGDGFTLPPPIPAGRLLQPLDTAAFDILFQPSGAGTWTGSLLIGERAYPLTGTAIGPPLPHPLLAIDLPTARSAQQGSIVVNLDAPARTTGAGTLTLDFEPLSPGPTDPTIQLGVVGRSLPFTIATGETQVRFGELAAVTLQTGSTAGTIVVSVELGGVTDRKLIVIPPEPVTITASQATRTASSLEVRVSGLDNTRTAGAIVYTFFDAAGLPLATIATDNSADFKTFFAASDAGGAFALRAVFPVTGDASKITAFEAELKNAAGSASTGRVKF